jgi:hypothetical protein
VSFRDLERAHRERRYQLVPQFEQYDANELYLRPYLTFGSRPGIDGPWFRTDALGYRLSTSPRGDIDCDRWLELGGGGIMLGGSYVFGVGATGDGATLPSRLADLSGVPQLNLGIYAGNSLQELIAAVPFLHAASTVLVCSGINNVFAALQSLGHNERYGPLFLEGALATLGRAPIADLAATVKPARGQPDAGSVGADAGSVGADAGSVGANGGADGADRRAAEAAAVRPSAVLTDEELSARMSAALDRQLRDLGVLAGAVRGRTRVLFCLQPFADPVLREPVPEERELFDLHQQRQGEWTRPRDFVATHWDGYARRAAEGCARLGVDFLDLPARRFTGWSFYDRVHMTDHGYRQAAEIIWEALCSDR